MPALLMRMSNGAKAMKHQREREREKEKREEKDKEKKKKKKKKKEKSVEKASVAPRRTVPA